MPIDCVFPQSRFEALGREHRSMRAALDSLPGEAELDPLAITTFALLGSFLGEQTPFAAVRFVRAPGEPAPRPFAGDETEACEELVRLVREYVGALPSAPRLHPLSGGRDSRHLLFALEHCGKRPQVCVTIATHEIEPDWAISSRVTEAVGVAHRKFARRSSGYAYNLAQPAATHLCADEHAWLLPVAETFRIENSVLLDGLLGDVQFNSAGQFAEDLAAIRRGDHRDIALRAMRYFAPASDDTIRSIGALLSLDLPPREHVERLVTAQLDALADEPNMLAQWWREQRLTRETALVVHDLYAGVGEVHTPYASRRIAEFMRSLPAAMTIGRSLHDAAIDRGYPRYASIGYTTKGPQPKVPRRPIRLETATNFVQNHLWESRHLARAERRALAALRPALGVRRTLWLRDLVIHRRSPEARRRAAEACRGIVGC